MKMTLKTGSSGRYCTMVVGVQDTAALETESKPAGDLDP